MLNGWAADIIDRLDSFTEVTLSETGIHVLVEGELQGAEPPDDVEVYDRDRFFTVAGERVVEMPDAVAHRRTISMEARTKRRPQPLRTVAT